MTDIRLDWETYNVDRNDLKLLDVVVAFGDAFPLKDADGNEVPSGALRLSDGMFQTAWEKTHTATSEGTSASLQSSTVRIFNTTMLMPKDFYHTACGKSTQFSFTGSTQLSSVDSGCGRGGASV